MTKDGRIYSGIKTVSSISDAVKTGKLHVKNDTKTLPNTMIW